MYCANVYRTFKIYNVLLVFFYLIFFDGNNVLSLDAMHETYAVYAHFHTEFRKSIHQSLHMFRVSCYAIISEARQLTVPK